MSELDDIKESIFGESSTEKDDRAKVMIVDDNPELIEAMGTLLKFDFQLVTCLTVETAMRRLTKDIKVVLLDIKMANVDGIQVFSLLKEKRKDLRIIFHSAYPGNADKAIAAETLDHDGYLTKGEYEKDELIAAQ